ncbi:hypothetical protein NEOLEDRAFT_1029343, partial [Neolentinus lepideus HHB14362 ss-1]
VFEVEWKSGDRMWLPYQDVAHLTPFRSYLDASGVDDIGRLPEGTGKPPSTDPQIYHGKLDLQSIAINSISFSPAPPRQSNPSLSAISLDALPALMSTTTPLPDFPKMTRDFDAGTVKFQAGNGFVISYTHAQVAAFWSFQTMLRSGNLPETITIPGGYSLFAHHYNKNTRQSRLPLFD